ncbi:response regulator [Massilia forsythiae]|uniref:Response regulator n=1 Tax=Massilia forsythiae TaxID=2728020 RepID=A0A7Z2W037_9BURK|nr:response regulator [Massilia forsythiae]QJE02389.1 response regulator [Massilia forsythiae]
MPGTTPTQSASTGPAGSPSGSQSASQPSSQLTVLVVDPNPGMRANLQNMLAASGIHRIEFAVNAGGAVKALARKGYDIVLCEYSLGSSNDSSGGAGQDGQQLLEDLRHHKLIAPWTIFIMLTAEGARDRVLGAAELAPTDYILKPFTPQVLNERIGRALARRAALLPAWQQAAQGDARAAIATCIAAAKSAPRYAVDFARLRAELHLALGESAHAEAVYRQVLAARPLGWARLGLARTLLDRQRADDALALLTALVADNPRLMAAYDLLARCHAARGEHAQARKALEEAVAISPHMVRRLRRLGRAALDDGDMPAAEKAFRQVVTRSRHSTFRNPEDHVDLVRALVGKGDVAAAGAVVRDLERSLRGSPETTACRAIAGAMLHEAAGETAAAAAALRQAVDAVRGGGKLSGAMRVGLARACLAQQLDEEASALMLAALHGNAADDDDDDDRAALSARQAEDLFVQAGRPDLADGMHRQLRAQARILLGLADEKRNMGDVRGAVQTLLEALRLAPTDLQVTLALVGGILRQVMEMGWDDALAALAAEQLAQLRALDATHPRLQALEAELAAARRKYGIGV